MSHHVRASREAAFGDVISGKRPQAVCRAATMSAVDDSIGGSQDVTSLKVR